MLKPMPLLLLGILGAVSLVHADTLAGNPGPGDSFQARASSGAIWRWQNDTGQAGNYSSFADGSRFAESHVAPSYEVTGAAATRDAVYLWVLIATVGSLVIVRRRNAMRA